MTPWHASSRRLMPSRKANAQRSSGRLSPGSTQFWAVGGESRWLCSTFLTSCSLDWLTTWARLQNESPARFYSIPVLPNVEEHDVLKVTSVVLAGLLCASANA